MTQEDSNKIDELHSFIHIDDSIIKWDYHIDFDKEAIYIQSCEFGNKGSYKIVIEKYEVTVHVTNLKLSSSIDLKKSVFQFLKYHNRINVIEELI